MEKTFASKEQARIETMTEKEAKMELYKTRKALKACIVAMVVAIVLLIAAFVVADMTPQRAYAANLTAGSVQTQSVAKAKAPYKDASAKKVGAYAARSIAFVKAHGGYKGIIKGTHYKKIGKGLYKKVSGKFYPSKITSRGEFLHVLGNLYGSKNVPVSYNDVAKSGKAATDKWAKSKMIGVAKKLGIKITWAGTNKKLSRATAANYLYVFAHYDKAFMPK